MKMSRLEQQRHDVIFAATNGRAVGRHVSRSGTNSTAGENDHQRTQQICRPRPLVRRYYDVSSPQALAGIVPMSMLV